MMVDRSRTGFLVASCAATALLLAGRAAAQDVSQAVLRDDLYIAGGNVVVSRDVPGDLVAAGGTVAVKGKVAQDALVAGGTVDVAGDVADVLRVAGGTVTLSGGVGGYLVAGGGTVRLLPNATVEGAVYVNAGQVILDGVVHGPVEIQGGDARINGTVDGEVEVRAGKLTLGESAVLKKGLAYRSRNEAAIASGAQVLGSIRRLPEARPGGRVARGLAVLPVPAIAKFTGLILAGIAIVLLFPAFSRSVTMESLSHFGRDLAIGGAVLFMAPAVAVLLVVSLVGLPLGVLGGLAYVTMLIVSTLCAGVYLGTFVWRLVSKGHEVRIDWMTAIVGLALLPAVAWIPILGWLICTALVVAALGSLSLLAYRAVRPGPGPRASELGGAEAA